MKIHIVKKGDTLYELANKYGTTLEQIIALNPQIADPNVIDVGMKVKIPSGHKKPEPAASDYVYKHVVQQGDTLWKLGKAWDVPLAAMIQANGHLKNPNVLMTGDIVYVPKAHHGHGHGQGQGQGQGHHSQVPGPGYHKPSTEPFPQAPVQQQPEPMQPVEPTPAVQEPAAPAPSLGEMSTQPAMPIPIVPAQPIMPMPTTPSMPAMPAPNMGMAPSSDATLNEPYPQAQHPFAQFHIQATEVFAYPSAEQPEPVAYPAYSPYQEAPCEPMPQMAMPAMPAMSAMPAMPAMPAMTAPMAIKNDCGCGGPSTHEMPWMNVPTGYPSGPLNQPWQGAAPMMADGQDMASMPGLPGFYPPVMPYDRPQAPFPFAYQNDPYGIPYAGANYQAPYESAIYPQVHTHELTESTDTEEELEIDIRKGRKSSANARSAKKARSASESPLEAFLRRQQRIPEKPAQTKQALPWINV
ncbi:LysM peptidoglycan-binding domain-containing protein [Paenibacillus oryzisoli]|uniref:LysM peptidoglycan-binding domain-containing protein n=1 Tax=Paenibacillus oryzisoli TaxID=1850517 RepID=UPI003D2B2845